MVFRLSTLSTLESDGVQYQTGDLSSYPILLDDKKSLYIVTNNAETVLTQTLPYNGAYIVVEDASGFPPYGLLTLGPQAGSSGGPSELVYYDSRNDTTFMNLYRGFAGSQQNQWPSGTTYVGNSVQAEMHNAAKDAIINMQQNIGLGSFAASTSLNGMLTSLENQYLAPKPLFRCFPLSGIPPLTVRFQNFSNNQAIRFLWDFGDGSQSSEKSPNHTYQTEGNFTVTLNMIMSTGAQGIATKTDYISISNSNIVPFFYVESMGSNTFEFVDQTDGDIASRYWVFGDGNNLEVPNPNIHTTTYTYTTPGTYNPSLLIVFADQSVQKVILQESVIVS